MERAAICRLAIHPSVRAASAEIEQEANRAREELRGQVSAVALAGAEKILNREIDAKTHQDILGKLAEEL